MSTIEWRKAIRDREFKTNQRCMRSQRIDEEHFKKHMYLQISETDGILGRIRKEKLRMEERLLRYNGEKAKIKSQQLLQQFEDEGDKEVNKPTFVIDTASEENEMGQKDTVELDGDNVFVSKLGLQQQRRLSFQKAALNSVPFQLTNSEEDIFNQFMDIKRQHAAEEQKGMTRGKEDEVNGLTLKKFLAKCRSRGKLDYAIEQAEGFIDDWYEDLTGNTTNRAEKLKKAKEKTNLHSHNVNLDALKTEVTDAGHHGLLGDTGKTADDWEKDFKAILVEAKKARYLRSTNPDIMERERVLTLDEIFHREATV